MYRVFRDIIYFPREESIFAERIVKIWAGLVLLFYVSRYDMYYLRWACPRNMGVFPGCLTVRDIHPLHCFSRSSPT